MKQSQFDALVRATTGDLYRFAYWLCREDARALFYRWLTLIRY